MYCGTKRCASSTGILWKAESERPTCRVVSVEVKGANTDVLLRSLSKDLAVTVIVIL